MTTRGITNCDPCNIRKSATKWAGASDEQTDPDFVVFKSSEYGLRAAARILLSYAIRGLNTPQKIVETWAPAAENNTAAYVADVCQRTGFAADTAMDIDAVATMVPLLKALVWHENGADPYTTQTYMDACRLAGVSDVPPARVLGLKEAVTGAGTAIAAANEVNNHVHDVAAQVNTAVSTATDTMSMGTHLFQMVAHHGTLVAVAFIACGVGLAVYEKVVRQHRLGF